MMNVYDLMLNFHDNYYEFYEWNKEDDIIHIKKINLIKISSEDYNNFLYQKVIINDEFLLSIFNKCEYFDNKKINHLPYAVLLTDSYRVMGVILDMNGSIIKYSSLSLEDEEDVIDLGDKLALLKLNYKIIDKKIVDDYKTRDEIEIINYIRSDLNESFLSNDIDKIKYLYYEYFDRESDDLNKIREDFEKELSKDINIKHYNLYQLIKLSRCKRRV